MLATEVSELTVASDAVFVTLKALDGKFVSDFIREMWTSRFEERRVVLLPIPPESGLNLTR
jgi:hypothetical protein